MQPPFIHLIDVTLRFNGQTLFDRFSCEISGGKCTCLLGPSGCGKSTLLGLISGSSRLKHEGRVLFSPAIEPIGGIGWMAQDDLLLPWLTVLDNVLLGSRLRNRMTAVQVEKAKTLLGEAGLGQVAGRLPGELSGGMRQRVALLRTLMEDCPVLLMDEPFSALDALTRMKLQNLAAGMTRGKTVLLVTHDPLEALRLADSIVVLGGSPVTVRSVIEMTGSSPRPVQDAEVRRRHPELLDLLMGEALA